MPRRSQATGKGAGLREDYSKGVWLQVEGVGLQEKRQGVGILGDNIQ